MERQKNEDVEKAEPLAPEDKARIERALETIRNTDPKQLSPETRKRAVRLFNEALRLLKRVPVERN